jgi:hypothetical protein
MSGNGPISLKKVGCCIHHDHGIASDCDVNVRKPNRDRALMPEISAQSQDADRPNGGIRALEIGRFAFRTEPSSTSKISAV